METTRQLRGRLALDRAEKNFVIVANLPKNSLSLATQAEEGGADAVILNIEGEESAYPGHFGNFELHDAYIKDVLSTISIPCGIFVGGARPMNVEYWETIISNNFSFVDMYAHQMPLFVLKDVRIPKLLSISAGYILEQVRMLSEGEGVEGIEVAIVPQQARGNPFTALDFATVSLISRLSTKPVLLRTQKTLGEVEVLEIRRLGLRGLVIDPCILNGPDEAYRDEIRGFRPRRESTD